MQQDHEANELQALLHEEYGAPPLDEQFSADLIARLQVEAAATPTVPAKPRRSLLAICLGVATVAASIITIVWILNQGIPGTNHDVTRRTTGDSDHLALLELSDQKGEKGEKYSRVDHLSESSRSMSSSPESESLPLSESLSDSKYSLESLVQRKESLVTEERKPRTNSLVTKLSVLDIHPEEWPNMSAAAALADMLYVVDSGHLYEVNTGDGSRRSVGVHDWQNIAAMGAAGGQLFIVKDNQLYEVNPKTGVRRSLGKPDWANTKAIVTAGDKLYIASNGLLHRVNSSDGSHEVLHNNNEKQNSPSPHFSHKPEAQAKEGSESPRN